MDETTPEAQEVQESPQQEAVAPQGNGVSISPIEVAGQQETAEDSLVPPGAEPHYPQQPSEAPEVQVGHLEAFLADQFPDEVGRTNYQVPETPVATAIRLLTGLHAQAVMTTPGARCTEPYCNKNAGHKDAHGWIHYG